MGLLHSPKITTDGLVVYYDFGNTKCYPGSGTAVSDLIMNKSGTMEGTCSFQSGAMDFTGPSDNTRLTISPTSSDPDPDLSFIDGTNDMSISIWFNADAFAPFTNSTNAPIPLTLYGNQKRNFMTFGDGGPVDQLHFRGQWATSGWNSPVSSSTLTLNTWHNFVVAYSATTGYIAYTDAVVSDTNSMTEANQANTSSAANAIGGPPDGWNRSFNGQIAMVSFYNKQLSASEVIQNYNTVKSRFGL